MKVSLKWLQTLVDVPGDIKEFTSRLDLTGTAVDGIETTGAALDGIVVGQILTRDKHPDADKLWVTTVDVGNYNPDEDGNPQPLQIVCGAQNFDAGDKVPVATIGSALPDGTVIKKAKMRGIVSQGMNCSARELGLGEDHAGLLILDAEAPVGVPIAAYLGLSDTVLDLEITPNRPDCMSVLGVAREVGAIYDRHYALPDVGELLADHPVLRFAHHPGTSCPCPEVRKDQLTCFAYKRATGAFVRRQNPSGGGELTPTLRTTSPEEGNSAAGELVGITIDDAGLCSRYTARIITGVKVGPSPDWLAARVQSAGSRSINNIVDVTNYIMYEVGQPLHAFDLDTLSKDAQGRAHVTVRAAADGERFTTLDGQERRLDSDITCIVDGNAAGGKGRTIALAGVMGGLDSEVTDATTTILLESAAFSSPHTSRTSRKLQLFSEASARYERGVDAQTCDEFSARAAALMAAVSGGTVVEGVVDAWPEPVSPAVLPLHIGRLRAFIGADIDLVETVSILTRLGCKLACHDDAGREIMAANTDKGAKAGPAGEGCHATQGKGCALASGEVDENDLVLPILPPSYRPDLSREVDLYEEVLRVWGMERVPSTLPGGRGRIGVRTVAEKLNAAIGATLRANGLNETMTYAFAPQGDNDLLQMPFTDAEQAVELVNPMNAEQSVLRRTILTGLLRSVAYNLNHGVRNVHLYEIGKVYFTSEGRKNPKEKQRLAGVLCGKWQEQGWNEKPTALDFFDAKGVLDNLLRELCTPKLRYKTADDSTVPWLTPGRAATVASGSRELGWIGEVHPAVLAALDIDQPVVAFELDMDALIATAAAARPYVDVPQYPAVELDIAIVVDEQLSAERLVQIITGAGGSLLEQVRVFDVYRDELKVGASRKSVALKLTYRDPERTLTTEEIDKLHTKVLKKLTGATGGEVRA